MSNNANLTKKERDCLVSIRQNSSDSFPIRVTALAQVMKIKPSTVEELLGRLESKELILRNKGMIVLTDKGNDTYKRIMMGHRALETFFVECGDDPDEACMMISKFDYLIDELTAERIISKMGNPKNCPHGRPIVEN